jgi:hypothetical protein
MVRVSTTSGVPPANRLRGSERVNTQRDSEGLTCDNTQPARIAQLPPETGITFANECRPMGDPLARRSEANAHQHLRPIIRDDEIIGRCVQRHWHQKLIRVLNAVERELRAHKPVHVVLRTTPLISTQSRYCGWRGNVEGLFGNSTRKKTKQ